MRVDRPGWVAAAFAFAGLAGAAPPEPSGPDLARRFADEAVKAAQRVLNIAVRALDYLPPVDITFGDYLRALVTADAELVPDDPRRHRVAFVEAFRERGILPDDVRSLGEDSLRWQSSTPDCVEALRRFMPPPEVLRTMLAGYDTLPELAAQKEWTNLDSRETLRRKFLELMWVQPPAAPNGRRDPRWEAFKLEGTIAVFLHQWLGLPAARTTDDEVKQIGQWLGLDLKANSEYLARRKRGEARRPDDMPVEVHDVRPTFRVKADGRTKVELVVVLTQKRKWLLPAADAGAAADDGFDVGRPTCRVDRDAWHGGNYTPYEEVDADGTARHVRFTFRGGCTLVIDPEQGVVRYAISKNVMSTARRNANARFYLERLMADGAAVMPRLGLEYADAPSGPKPHPRALEPLALLHRDTDPGGY